MSVLASQEDRELRIQAGRLRSKSQFPWASTAPARAFNPSAGHSTAPFACECQSFLDNFIAGLVFAGEGLTRVLANDGIRRTRRWKRRLFTQPGDRELMTSDALQAACPDLLITNYSMLECMKPIRCAENLRALAKAFELIAFKKTRVA